MFLVGYGDLAPTSWIGRMIANIVMIIGIVVLALPIGVLGSNFTSLYAERLQLDWRKAADVLDVDGLDEQGIIDMFRHFDDVYPDDNFHVIRFRHFFSDTRRFRGRRWWRRRK